ncbi:MAG: hypothetical protein R2788_03475 [Saprospiraceae bacterium]
MTTNNRNTIFEVEVFLPIIAKNKIHEKDQNLLVDDSEYLALNLLENFIGSTC